MKSYLTPILILIFLVEVAYGQINFELPDRVCVNEPFTIKNLTNGASNFYWSFCVADPIKTPGAENIGNIGNALSLPVFLDFVEENGNFFAFVTNYLPGGLTRLDFGNSLLNSPTATYFGNFNGMLPPGEGTEGLQVVKNDGRWYVIIVGGNPSRGSDPRIIKLDFGPDIKNPNPIATNWGNIGNMEQPVDLHIFKENDNWYGLTVNAENNTITRFNFTNSFNNTPTAQNLGNIGSLNFPTGIYAILNQGNWYVFVVNGGRNQATGAGSSLTRLNFGNSLLNIPTGVNLGNPGNILHFPRDISIYNYCDQIVGFAVNGTPGYDDIAKFDFKNDLTLVPTGSTLGNIGNLSYPHSISKVFRVDNDLFAFITNVNNNTLTRVKFSGCTNSNLQGSSDENPPPIVYASPGTYNISLTIDEGLSTQATLCKQINVGYDEKRQDFSYSQDICNPLMVNFFNNANLVNIGWDFGDATPIVNTNNPTHLFGRQGDYKIRMWSLAANCGNGIIDTITKFITLKVDTSDIILTSDTTICNETIQLRANDAIEYCWSPSTYLDNPKTKNPNVNPLSDITYRLISKTLGSNLVVNGNFNAGNTGFATAYKFASNNVTEGEYFVGSNPQLWNPGVFPCNDHTGTNGNMLMVNGSPQDNVEVWRQTINVTPNTSYEFSTWLQSLHFTNPAQLQFSINGIQLGEVFFANINQCVWTRFSTIWNSGDSTKATISIVNKNTIALGNDFALDDISFSSIKFNTDSIRIKLEKPMVKVNMDTAVCANSIVQLNASGASSYSWSPGSGLSDSSISNPLATVNSPVQYIVKGFSSAGCDASDTINIDVLPPPNITISNDTAVCGLMHNIQLKAEGGVLFDWLPSAGLNNSKIPNPIANPLFSTVYTVKVTGVNTCSVIDSVKITINDFPKVVISNDTSICENASFKLFSSGGLRYSWSPAIGLDNPNIAEPIASPFSPTVYTVNVTDSNNCSSVDSVAINMLLLPQVMKSNDTTVCINQVFPLFVTGGETYQWLPADGLSNNTSSNPIVTVAQPVRYSIVVTGSNNCSVTEFLNINTHPTTNLIITSDTSVCKNSILELSVSGANTYQWFPLNAFTDPFLANPIVKVDSDAQYWVTGIDDNGCASTDSVMVTLHKNADFGLVTSNQTGCADQPIQLEVYGGDFFQWTPSTGLNNPNIRNPIAIIDSSVTYSIYARESVCNIDTVLFVTLDITPLANITIGKSNDITCKTPSSLLSASGGVSYRWQPTMGLSNPTISNPIAMPLQTTWYTVNVTGDGGCVGKDSIEIRVDSIGDLMLYQLPDAFTPNGDGLNDCFGVSKWGNRIQINYFKIFDRWGQLVFNGNSINFCWDGNFNGKPKPTGNYIYTIQALTPCGTVNRKGNLVLIR